MAVAFKAAGTFTAGIGAITPPYPTAGNAPVANDVALLIISSENEAISLTTANGFNIVGSATSKAAGTAATDPASRLVVYWKRCVGSDSAPVVADSGNNTEAQILLYSGCRTVGNPWDVFAEGNDSAANDTTGTIPSTTTNFANTLVVLICSTSFNGTSTVQFSAWTNANLGSLTERADNSDTSGLGGGFGVADGTYVGPGDYGSSTVTLANTSFKGTMSIALTDTYPTSLTQASHRFYADGTESGSTALAAQDANYTAALSGSDVNLALRVRIQEGNTGTGLNGTAATDAYELYYSRNSGAYEALAVGTVLASAAGNAESQEIYNTGIISEGQTFAPASNATLTSFQVHLSKLGTPTGTLTAYLYATTGTYGINDAATGSPLATSTNTVSIAGLTTSFVTTTFSFSGYALVAGVDYALVIIATSLTGDVSNFVNVQCCGFGAGTYAGLRNYSSDGTSWTADPNYDQTFSILGTLWVKGFNSANFAEGDATTNRLGAGTGSFLAGKISEDGEVNNLQVTVGTYTEVLFSLTLVNSALANADTFDFKVYRNSAVINTYTVTPRITISVTTAIPNKIVQLNQAVKRASYY